MSVAYPFLFNFAASYSQGGYKRLHEYARWFDGHGGASFIIHPRCDHLRGAFPANRFFIVSRSHLRRLVDDWSYLADIGRSMGQPELYYAYGIPLYRRFGVLNWFHLQNVLTVGRHDAPLSLRHRLKFRLLGRRFRNGFPLADVVSAESCYSLQQIGADIHPAQAFLSVNGSDDELARLRSRLPDEWTPIATAVGTISYKALSDAYRVFQSLKINNPPLRLMIVGDPQLVTQSLRRQPDVTCLGTLPRPEVIALLKRSRYYLSTTYAENSYNCAAEGIFHAQESYISDIPPHRELLEGEVCAPSQVPGSNRPMLHLHRDRLKGLNLKSWDSVIIEMIARVRPATAVPSAVQEIRRAS
jgi:glycosyltransferase involved in cell wall biosynthesis